MEKRKVWTYIKAKESTDPFSIETQRKQLEEYCHQKGYEVIGRSEVSGDFDAVKEELRRIADSTEAQSVIAAKMNHLSRQPFELVAAKKICDDAGLEIEFASDPHNLQSIEIFATLHQMAGDMFEEECNGGVPRYDSDKPLDKFYARFNEILEDVDLVTLENSCNGEDNAYAAETLKKLHDAFVESYGTETLKMYDYEEVVVPGVAIGNKTGRVALVLLTLDLTSSGEHWGTEFLTSAGVITQGDRNNPASKEVSEMFVPYTYWYTPSIEGDIHADFEAMPHVVEELIGHYHAENQEQNMEGMDF